MRRTRSRAVVGLGLVAALASGCGVIDRPGPIVDLPPPAPATIHSGWPGCQKLNAFASYATSPPDLGAGSVPADFTTQTVVRCDVRDDVGATPTQDQRTPATGFERQGDDPTDVRAVVAYLALPSQSQPDPSNAACPAMAEIDPWLFLLDATGRWIQPALPRTPCGFSRGTLDGSPLPYTTMTFTDTAICRVPTDGDWRCEPL